MKKIPCIILCLLSAWIGNAQTVYKNQIRIEKQSITRGDDNRLTISMDVILQTNMKLSSNYAAKLTPILQSEGHTQALPTIVVYGRRRALINEREKEVPKDTYTTLRRKNDTEQKVSYLVQLPYETWMQQANLNMNADLCGCCNSVEDGETELITQLNIMPEKPNPSIAYITPQAEPVKHRAIVGKAFLDFPVNKTTIMPEYRNNIIELGKIRATIDTVRNDRNTEITGITIEGYASPEGSYASNARLAEGRTLALMEYVRNYYKFDNKIIATHSTPEDWAGYRKFVEASTMDKKAGIIRLMDNNEMDIDKKERGIAILIGKEAYQYLLNDCYPALRHSDYTVNYTVRGFNLEESKEIIDSHPQQLSLQEIFRVAQSYQPGSSEFNHAFQIAALMFPDDLTANLNAAAMEIQKGGDLTAAKKYLAKADPKAGATLNNWGIIAMLEGNLDAAGKYFDQAKVAGAATEAEANLQELKKQHNYPVK